MAPLRVVTANLRNGGADPRALAKSVSEIGADVVAVQELSPDQARELEKVLPHGQLAPAHDFKGMGIAARSPVSIQRLPLPGRDAWVARLGASDGTSPNDAIEIVNVHVFSPVHRPIREAFAIRRAQLAGLERYLVEAPILPRALVGDLNSTPLWPLYRRLAAHFDDAARIAARRQGSRPRRTWGPAARGPRLLRIDHILVRRLVVGALQVVQIVGSDHSGVACELALAEPKGAPSNR